MDCTTAQIAEFFEVDPRTVRRWKAEGLRAVREGVGGAQDVFRSTDVIQFLVQRELAKSAGREPGESFDYNAERARLTKLQADHEGLKVKQKAGELAPVQAMEMILSAQAIAARTKWLGIVSKLKSRYSVGKDVLEALDELVREGLEELSAARLPKELGEALGGYGERVEAASEADAEPVG